MAVILEMTDSAYFPCFRTLFRNVVGGIINFDCCLDFESSTLFIIMNVSALTEARDIDMHLKGIARHFQGLEDTDFSEIVPLFRPMFHVLCLIWGESKYYCQSSRLMVVLKEICNLLIYQVNFMSFVLCCNKIFSFLFMTFCRVKGFWIRVRFFIAI